ncbi:MAG TPA: sigma-70 family RNA polymerase sigma factor [Solirubrobacteraceae bacterium]|nr:sigma-70 family RNA polymerase sigma factor [Solirubrobacteraceae bacterium]
MERDEHLAGEFEEHRDHLKAVAYRMLGSVTEAEDAVQEAWLRLQRADDDRIMNLGGWLTTAVARVSLDMLRARRTKSLDPFEEGRMPDPLVESYGDLDPEHEAVLADSVGLAVLVVLETLTPAERLAFVLHDMFSVPFGEIAEIVGRSPEASRQLASRARRRVRGSAPVPDRDLRRRREVSDAFLAASRDGRFEDLLALLDPDVVLRVDEGDGIAPRIVHGAEAVSRQAFAHRPLARFSRPALVNGDPGGVVVQDGVATAIVALTVADGRIVAMDILADPRRLANLDLSEFGVEHGAF